MPNLALSRSSLLEMDLLALQEGPIQRLDPRAKLAVTLLFLVTVVSFDKYAVLPLLPLLAFPLFLTIAGRVPMRVIGRLLLFTLPLVLFLGIFNPVLDRHPMPAAWGTPIVGGWVSLTSILLRFVLTVTAGAALVATTGMIPIAWALQRFRLPRAFVVQLLLLYRYLFVLMEEAARMTRAFELRSAGKGLTLKTFGTLAGSLLIRTLDRAERIHRAMCCRGFDGRIELRRTFRFGAAEAAFVVVWIVFLVLCRFPDLPGRLGGLLTGGTP